MNPAPLLAQLEDVPQVLSRYVNRGQDEGLFEMINLLFRRQECRIVDEESLAIGAAMQTLNALSILRGEDHSPPVMSPGARERT